MNIRKEYIREVEPLAGVRGWVAMGMFFPVAVLALEAVQSAALERSDPNEAMLIEWVPSSTAGHDTARALATGKYLPAPGRWQITENRNDIR